MVVLGCHCCKMMSLIEVIVVFLGIKINAVKVKTHRYSNIDIPEIIKEKYYTGTNEIVM